ncbi:DUF3558 family protein [Rhodococcoides yunnanense]|uniref:DUF3558 family protein n=1 Tax=Rhodococcoides yunnanense TaxID=278209 RepID=UPI001472D2D3|nr:DUF3558 family protein [Rhodococcus yunnanensis]
MRTSVAVVIVGTALLGGCSGSGDEIGVATPAPPRWDPCSISAEAIEATGLDPTYRQIGWPSGIVVDDWSLCKFRATPEDQSYFLNVLSSDVHTLATLRQDDSNLHAVDSTIGGRDAYQYETSVSRAVTDCNVATEVTGGIVVFTVDFVGGTDPASDPCELAQAHAIDLEPLLPPSER